MPETTTGRDNQTGGAASALPRRRIGAFWLVAGGAGLVAFFAAMSVPSAGFAAASVIGVPVPHGFLAWMAIAVPPLLGLAGVLLSLYRRLLGHLLVLMGGLGTCAVVAVAVLLAGPHQYSFLPLQEGATPGKVVAGAIVATVAALTMMVASAIGVHTD
jgi:hypothetical protein